MAWLPKICVALCRCRGGNRGSFGERFSKRFHDGLSCRKLRVTAFALVVWKILGLHRDQLITARNVEIGKALFFAILLVDVRAILFVQFYFHVVLLRLCGILYIYKPIHGIVSRGIDYFSRRRSRLVAAHLERWAALSTMKGMSTKKE